MLNILGVFADWMGREEEENCTLFFPKRIHLMG